MMKTSLEFTSAEHCKQYGRDFRHRNTLYSIQYTATDKSLVASNVLSQFTQHTTFSLHSFSSSGRTDLQKYSNSPSWSTDSKNVKTIFVGSGVQVQLKF